MLSVQSWPFCSGLCVWIEKTSFTKGSQFFVMTKREQYQALVKVMNGQIMQGGLWLVNTSNVDLFHPIEMEDIKHIDWTSRCDVSWKSIVQTQWHVNHAIKAIACLMKQHPTIFMLTHCVLVTSYGNTSVSTLAQVMACCLTAPSHYLNQCWLIIRKVQRYSPEWNLTRDNPTINH